MQSVIYQLTLVIGLGTLAVLLIKGVSLQEALVRSGLVLVAVLFLLIIAGNILRFSMRSRGTEEEEAAKAEPIEHKAEPARRVVEPAGRVAGPIEPVKENESEGGQAAGT